VRVSIIVPVYNEESTVEALLGHLTGLGADEILIVDGASEDRTQELASRWGQPVRLLSAERGRAAQMNAGARAASGDVLLFLHADVSLGAGAVEAVRRAFDDPVVIGGNLDTIFGGDDWVAASFTWIYRKRLPLGIFYGDSGIFCRRSVFEEFGGYKPWPVMEDYEFARRLWKRGRLAYLPVPVHVSPRRWRRAGLLPTLWTWIVIQGGYTLGVSPHRLARWYAAIR